MFKITCDVQVLEYNKSALIISNFLYFTNGCFILNTMLFKHIGGLSFFYLVFFLVFCRVATHLGKIIFLSD